MNEQCMMYEGGTGRAKEDDNIW